MDDDRQAMPSLGDLILEQTAEAVIYSDRQGMIERWNGAATAMFGHTFAEAHGQSLAMAAPFQRSIMPCRSE